MRGLTPAEEETLQLVLRNTTDAECGACEQEPSKDMTLDDSIFLALHKRGLLRVEACAIVPGMHHCFVTDLGKSALACASAVRSLEP